MTALKNNFIHEDFYINKYLKLKKKYLRRVFN